MKTRCEACLLAKALGKKEPKSRKMTRAEPGDGFDSKTCVCCLCRCGDHKCLQQLVLELPLPMQLQLKSDKIRTQERCARKASAYESDLYRKTSYKRDFCEQHDAIDKFPLEQKKLVTTLKPHSGYYSVKESTYRDDYIPWCRAEQEVCRARLHVPDDLLEKVPADGQEQELTQKVSDELYNYYCPSHCIGDKEEPKVINCLTDHRDRFNIGPPVPLKQPVPDRPRHPFTKFTNYRLDYKGDQLSPRQKKSRAKVEKSLCPMATETSYRCDFTCPPENRFSDESHEGKPAKDKRSTLRVGDGLMLQESTAMLDFKDPDVSAHKPVRPARDVYKHPACRMETSTTTGRSYPRWKELPNQVKPQKQTTDPYGRQHQEDTRHIFTTYQEDFDGLNFALCPCKVVEKYGPKVLSPRYRYTESEKLHDFFSYDDKKIPEPKGKACPH